MKIPPDESAELATLAALGFGPDTPLMTDPRLFVDDRLLGALVVELEDELGMERAARILFQVGLMHGLRDASRVVANDFAVATAPVAASAPTPSPLAILFDAPGRDTTGGIEIGGAWPEHFEAGAWLGRFGPGDLPSCWLSAGYTSGWLSGTLERDLVAVEAECAACGSESCRFVARESEAWELAPEAPAAWLGSVDFPMLRELATRATREDPVVIESEGDFEPDAPLVHIWGPVMVLPYLGPDDVMGTVEMLSHDPNNAGVRSVVIDLRDRQLDEDLDAVAIEHVLATVEAWGAEPILTGVAQLSEQVVVGLQAEHLLVRKDMSEAIAAAFQIAEAQRHPL